MLLQLAHSRNLTWTGTAKALYAVTDGRICLSPSTIGGIGRGTVEATPELVAGLAGVLGIPAPGLAALGGIHLPDDLPPAATSSKGVERPESIVGRDRAGP
ncbi:hypothetical protein ACFCX4_05445 [Kitasatospora sp. NPDC056327]|uniref:hypothetical protein n=1 Tax=Kitasatospora sp. NPDC056327 TaxID=3345785 RepID=UPI0035D7331D